MGVLGMQTRQGRSTPLVWKTVTRSELLSQRNEHEDELLGLLASILPGDVRVTVVADRGFGDTKLFPGGGTEPSGGDPEMMNVMRRTVPQGAVRGRS